MSDQSKILLYIKDMLADLIYINSVVATELIKITENTAVMRHGEEFLAKSPCISEHNAINKDIISIMKKYCNKPIDFERNEGLEKHVLKHLEE